MRKLITASTAVSIVLIVVILTLGYNIYEKAQESITEVSEKYEERLGKSITINNETYVITDYSLIDETFILDNGSTIKYSLVEKLEDPF